MTFRASGEAIISMWTTLPSAIASPAGGGRYLADRIPHAAYPEFPGEDQFLTTADATGAQSSLSRPRCQPDLEVPAGGGSKR
jgi:hypothetical protein